jgi:hypothetical protein
VTKASRKLADELNELGQFVRTVLENWLAFNQQAMEEPLEISADENISPRLKTLVEALSLRTQGSNPRTIKIDPMDIQEEFEVLPEEGSTLADDDEYRLQKIQQGLQLAIQIPQVLNVRAFATALVQAIPGISPEQAILPPPPPPSPLAGMRVGLNVTAKFEDLSPDVQTALLKGGGLPTEGQATIATIAHGSKAIQAVSHAADAAANLHAPAVEEPTPPGVKAAETKAGA